MTEKARLKERIITSSIAKFTKYGYTQVKTDEIAADAGISKRTLYELFGSKKELLSEALQYNSKEIEKEIDSIVKRIIEKKGSDFIREVNRLFTAETTHETHFTKEAITDIRKSQPDVWDNIDRFRARVFEKNFRKIYSIGVEEGYFRADVNQDLVRLIFLSSIQNILVPEVLSILPMTFFEVKNSILDIMSRGILSEKGQKVLKMRPPVNQEN